MYKIYKTTLSSPVDYAAEELKKYLRMMMTECGEIDIAYDPKAETGFRLGLMQDFGLDISDAEDPVLDDILYIDADAEGGIIAGDNPRSVLLAVYEYLRQQGCRWLFPGVDGEFIPEVEGLKPIHYRHKPSCRYRGQCNEGAEFQPNMLDAIEFTPKLGMNVFMMEFRIPAVYYRKYYNHQYNDMNRPPEPVSDRTVLQWKRQCEAEIARRGLQFHDMGHGFCVEAFGIDSAVRNAGGENDKKIPPEARQYLALQNGERKLVADTPNFTQFCMSNEVAREKIVQYIADYSQTHTNVDYMHIWLGDAINHHCECENCKKKTPSDWYMMLLNEVDAELTRRNLDTRAVFIVYTDTVWPPETEKLLNPKRFTLLLAPISRSYTESLPAVSRNAQTKPYERNKLVMPKTLEENFAYFAKWKEMWKGANMAYEYHFWRHQFYDVGGIALSKIINEDVRSYKKHDVNGIIQDGSQRSFFPTGLVFYTYARTLFDSSLTAEQLAEEYFSCAFGENWKPIYDYLEEVGKAIGFGYLEGEMSSDPARSPYYNPEHVKSLQSVREITAKGRELIAAHYNKPFRVQTASVRVLELHAEFVELLADALIPKAQGNDEEAKRLRDVFMAQIGKKEVYFETCYDHHLAFYAYERIFNSKTKQPDIIY